VLFIDRIQELAWLWLQNQPTSALSLWFHERVRRLDGRMRKTTIVALARKLLIALWRYTTAGGCAASRNSRTIRHACRRTVLIHPTSGTVGFGARVGQAVRRIRPWVCR
jgi:hypothetical protein